MQENLNLQGPELRAGEENKIWTSSNAKSEFKVKATMNQKEKRTHKAQLFWQLKPPNLNHFILIITLSPLRGFSTFPQLWASKYCPISKSLGSNYGDTVTPQNSVQGLRRAETPFNTQSWRHHSAPPESGQPRLLLGPKQQKLQGGGCAGAANCRSPHVCLGMGVPGPGPAGSELHSSRPLAVCFNN